MRKPDNPLYLAVMKKPQTEVWFKKQPLGKHSLGKRWLQQQNWKESALTT